MSTDIHFKLATQTPHHFQGPADIINQDSVSRRHPYLSYINNDNIYFWNQWEGGREARDNYGQQVAHYSGGGAHGKFPTEPTDTMIVRNLDLNSTEKSISDAFGYITKELFIKNTC